MQISFTLLFDFLASLAFVIVLAFGYSSVLHKGVPRNVASIALGVLFGAVAVMEMYRPLTLADGVIVDLRTIPVILAGAFLGWRGLLACLVIACAFRIGIGGIGAAVGILGMTLAGTTALAWAHLTRHVEARGTLHMVALGVMTLTQMLAILLLPPEIRTLLVSSVMAPLIALNVLIVPAVAFLFDREHRHCETEKSLRTSARIDPVSGLLYGDAWLSETRAAHAAGDVAGVLQVDLGKRNWLIAQFGTAWTNQLISALRYRMKALLSHGDMIAQSACGRLMVPVTSAELSEADGLVTSLRRVVADQAFGLPDGGRTRLSISAEAVQIERFQEIAEIFNDRRSLRSSAPGPSHRAGSDLVNPKTPPRKTGPKARFTTSHDSLYSQADRLSSR